MARRKAVVFDCSAIVPWFLEEEASAWSERLLDGITKLDVHVPALWHLEFPNVLLNAERRGRIGSETRAGLIERAARLPLMTDSQIVSLADISRLAMTYNLSTYDAAYLELALRLGARLATQDRALIGAAHKARVALISP